MNHGIILHEEYRNRMKQLSPERLGKLVQNMFRVDDGQEPLEFPDDEALSVISEWVCKRLKWDIEQSDRQRSNGSKGGAPVGNQNARKTSEKQPKTTQKQPKNNPKQTSIDNNQLTISNNNKKTYGECQNVKLTEDEYNKLVEKNYTGLIDELSLYIASKGDKYKSHYATILQWAKKREKETLGTIPFKPKEKPHQQMMKTTYDMDALEKKLIKN